jgi:hypothetical protein
VAKIENSVEDINRVFMSESINITCTAISNSLEDYSRINRVMKLFNLIKMKFENDGKKRLYITLGILFVSCSLIMDRQ